MSKSGASRSASKDPNTRRPMSVSGVTADKRSRDGHQNRSKSLGVGTHAVTGSQGRSKVREVKTSSLAGSRDRSKAGEVKTPSVTGSRDGRPIVTRAHPHQNRPQKIRGVPKKP